MSTYKFVLDCLDMTVGTDVFVTHNTMHIVDCLNFVPYVHASSICISI